MPKRYVLLVRHAARKRDWAKGESTHRMQDWDYSPPWVEKENTQAGYYLTRSLVGQLCDQLQAGKRKIEVDEIFYSKHKIARQTAMEIEFVLHKRELLAAGAKCVGSPGLTPKGHDGSNARLIGLVRRFFKKGRLTRRSARKRSEGKEKKNKKSSLSDKEEAMQANEEETDLATIVISHQPQLTYLARYLLDKSLWERNLVWKGLYKLRNLFPNNSLPANVLPLGNSEIACIEMDPRPRLLWLLTEKSSALLVELKTKIASKYDVAKFFLGALVVGTGLTLSDPIWKLPHTIDKVLAGCGAFAALISLGLTAATLFSYDRLLMPQEFWSEADTNSRISPLRYLGHLIRGSAGRKPPRWNVSRPPSQAHTILFYEMVHTWTHLFIPAIVFAFVALGFLIVAMAHHSLSELINFSIERPQLRVPRLAYPLGFSIIAFIVGIIAFRLWKPRLGFDD